MTPIRAQTEKNVVVTSHGSAWARGASVRFFNRGASRSFDPVRAEDLGDGFLMRHGFTLVWVGWQHDVPETAELLRLYPVHATVRPDRGGWERECLVSYRRKDKVVPRIHASGTAWDPTRINERSQRPSSGPGDET